MIVSLIPPYLKFPLLFAYSIGGFILHNCSNNKSKFILPKLNLVKNTCTQTHGANNVPSKFDHANSKIYTFAITRHPLKSSYSKDLDSFLFNLCFRPKDALYPWRILFLTKCLFLDPMFFLKKAIITIKKKFIYKIKMINII